MARLNAIARALEIVRGLEVPVAALPHLIALKLLARDDRRRPQDHDDLLALFGVATERDLGAAREAVRAITARGYARGRDLEGALDALLAE